MSSFRKLVVGLLAWGFSIGVTAPCALAHVRCPVNLYGGHIPNPLRGNVLIRAELAPEESYDLQGWLIKQAGHLYFRVNYKIHPWLETKARVINPYYPVLASSQISETSGKLPENQEVPAQLTFKTVYRMQTTTSVSGQTTGELVIALMPISRPTFLYAECSR